MEREIAQYMADQFMLTSEVLEYLNISRQHLAYIVATKKIIPVKTTKSGNLYYKPDVDEYKNRRKNFNLIIPHSIIGKTTYDAIEYIQSEIDNKDDVIAIYCYYSYGCAYADGFYTCEELARKDTLVRIVCPSFVLKFANLDEIWFDSLTVGYSGSGPNATYQVLRDCFNVPEKLLKCIYSYDKIKYYKEDNEWHCYYDQNHAEETNKEIIEQYCDLLNYKHYYFNNNPVVLHTSNKMQWIEHGKKIEQYLSYIPHPVSITIFSKEQAYKTHHIRIIDKDLVYYQIVIKDHSGKELWLDESVDINKDISQNDTIRDVLIKADLIIPQKGLIERFKDFFSRKLQIIDEREYRLYRIE